jgi:hypothetical protein
VPPCSTVHLELCGATNLLGVLYCAEYLLIKENCFVLLQSTIKIKVSRWGTRDTNLVQSECKEGLVGLVNA